MAPKTSRKNAAPMTQSVLGFTSTKRAASSNAKKPVVKPTVSTLSKTRQLSTGSEIDEISIHESSSSSSSEEDLIEDSPDTTAHKTEQKVDSEERAQTVSNQLAATNLSQEAEMKTARTSASKTEAAPKELPELNTSDAKWRKPYADAKEKMGGLQSIHAQNQTMIHDILRVFDNTYEYGPCVGISRLDRWERANDLGLNPPQEVHDILQTKQGSTMDEYTQSVFYNQV